MRLSLSVVLVSLGFILLFASPLVPRILAIAGWGDIVVKDDGVGILVGRYMTYYNDFRTARWILPRVYIETNEGVFDSGRYLGWVVNPGEIYVCLPGWHIPASYNEREAFVRITIYTADAPSLANMVLEGETEFTVTIPARRPPPEVPKIVIERAACYADGDAVYGFIKLRNAGSASGVAEVYFTVGSVKYPPGEEMYYTPFIEPGNTYTMKFGRWLWRGETIYVHVNTKCRMTDPPIYCEGRYLVPEPTGGEVEGEEPASMPIQYRGERYWLSRDIIIASATALIVAGLLLACRE